MGNYLGKVASVCGAQQVRQTSAKEIPQKGGKCMRRFEIVDGARRNAQPCAQLIWDDVNDTLAIDINSQASASNVPMLFEPFLRAGKLHIDDKWARRWIEERIVPSSRQNLAEVLLANKLGFYDPMALFIAGEGRCAQDDFFIREVSEGEVSESEATKAKAGKNKLAKNPTVNTKTAAQQAGYALKNARAQANLSQMELANRAGLHQPVLSKLESGHANPTVGLLEDLARALGKRLEIRFA